MAYASQADLVTRFGEHELVELTDRADPPSGEIDAAVVTAALADTDGEINGYLGVRYPLPLVEVPGLVLDIACDIARYRLFGHRATVQVEARYEAAISLLEKIRDGEQQLQLASGAEVAAADTILIDGGDRFFTRDRLKGF